MTNRVSIDLSPIFPGRAESRDILNLEAIDAIKKTSFLRLTKRHCEKGGPTDYTVAVVPTLGQDGIGRFRTYDADGLRRVTASSNAGAMLTPDSKEEITSVFWYTLRSGRQAATYLGNSLERGQRREFLNAYMRAGYVTDVPKASHCWITLADHYSDAQGSEFDLEKSRTCYEKGFSYFRKGSENGDAKSTAALGRCHARGFGTPVDLTKAYECFLKAAYDGDKSAMAAVGDCLLYGTGCPANEARAFHWLKMASDRAVPSALLGLGRCYLYGWGAAINLAEAFRCFRKANEGNDSSALAELGSCYVYGMGVQADVGKGLELVKRAAVQGKKIGLRRLACIYRDGRGVARDEKNAMELFEQAGNLGDAMSWVLLAHMVEQVDAERAFRYFKKASDLGALTGLVVLGEAYLKGMGTCSDRSLAISCFKEAVLRGSPEGMYWLGICCLDGQGPSSSSWRGLDLIRQAAERGVSKAWGYLIEYYPYGCQTAAEVQRAMRLFEAGMNVAPGSDLSAAGLRFFKSSKVQTDLFRAIELFRAATKKKDPLGTRYLAICYRDGLGTIPISDLAIELFERAGRLGDASAWNELGCFLEESAKATGDWSRVFKCYERAYQGGSHTAILNLGACYREGKGVPADREKALALFKEAADQGDPRGQRLLERLSLGGQSRKRAREDS